MTTMTNKFATRLYGVGSFWVVLAVYLEWMA